MRNEFFDLKGIKTIGISGHINPDGDCTGSCMALKGYLNNILESEDVKVDVYLEPISNSFKFLAGSDEIINIYDEDIEYDLFISVDCASKDRLGKALKYFELAKKTVNIDHHVSNTKFADINYVLDNASSTCEVLCTVFDYNKIDKFIAEALYLGIAHDTGVFKHSNTSKKTMEVVGSLIAKEINFSKIIDETFYQKTHNQNQILGKALMDSKLILDGKVIVSSVNQETIGFYQLATTDLEGIIDQLRITEGVEVAIFIYENENGSYKVSMRSNNDVNVSKIAVENGGGGHIKAAGCIINAPLDDIVENLSKAIEMQLHTK